MGVQGVETAFGDLVDQRHDRLADGPLGPQPPGGVTAERPIVGIEEVGQHQVGVRVRQCGECLDGGQPGKAVAVGQFENTEEGVIAAGVGRNGVGQPGRGAEKLEHVRRRLDVVEVRAELIESRE